MVRVTELLPGPVMLPPPVVPECLLISGGGGTHTQPLPGLSVTMRSGEFQPQTILAARDLDWNQRIVKKLENNCYGNGQRKKEGEGKIEDNS